MAVGCSSDDQFLPGKPLLEGVGGNRSASNPAADLTATLAACARYDTKLAAIDSSHLTVLIGSAPTRFARRLHGRSDYEKRSTFQYMSSNRSLAASRIHHPGSHNSAYSTVLVRAGVHSQPRANEVRGTLKKVRNDGLPCRTADNPLVMQDYQAVQKSIHESSLYSSATVLVHMT